MALIDGLIKTGQILGQGAQKLGNVIKTGAQKTGEVIKTGKDKFIDFLNSEPVAKGEPIPQQEPLETTGRKRFANALAETKLPQNNYRFEPSMVDYSQFMGLSPEVQKYLYRGM